ncbi:sensor histidine kinase [Denitromonas iodatirespirans]|uniref:C4-dicarboxylate transport sensor protein DctB n=1 Tax=Denitromonas iodatirespirans TaxID=2795389 RepID=A0A944H958_DENI1|nr:ATP-binding protein [Denitromonas iodatirespirans]MBT0962919.1 sensor histidine kinase [Denitromonas iodatirespirans]
MAEPSAGSPARRRRRVRRALTVLVLVLGVALVTYLVSQPLARRALDEDASHRLKLFATAVEGLINRYTLIPSALDLNSSVVGFLLQPFEDDKAVALSRQLALLNARIGAQAVYVLDTTGRVLASSNWNRPDSFVGEDLSFRPYFQRAVQGASTRHFAVGTTRGDPGYYYAQPIHAGDQIIGVAVVKIGLQEIERAWPTLDRPALIHDSHGVVILSSEPAWRYSAIAPIDAADRVKLDRERLYGEQVGMRLPAMRQGDDREVRLALPTGATRSRPFLAHSRGIDGTDWTLVLFTDLQPAHVTALGHAALAACLAGVALLLLQVAAQRRRILLQRLENQSLLERTNQRLEITVGERTAALTEVNRRLRDEVAERQATEASLREAQNELVQAAKLAVLGQLSAGITHELSQPLGAIRTLAGNAIAFLERGDPHTAAHNLGIVNRLIHQMGSIIAPLKSFARKSPAQAAAVDTACAVSNALVLLAPRLQAEAVAVSDLTRAGEVFAWCDQNRLEQVLVNVIGNACDAMRQCSPRHVEIAARAVDRGVALTVSDCGPGFTPEVEARLFEPFFTTKPSGDGLGLGLAISRDILRELGGDMTARATPGEGAEFCILLPPVPQPRVS